MHYFRSFVLSFKSTIQYGGYTVLGALLQSCFVFCVWRLVFVVNSFSIHVKCTWVSGNYFESVVRLCVVHRGVELVNSSNCYKDSRASTVLIVPSLL
jgi:hypothetical protein